jgi:hypothetical protein
MGLLTGTSTFKMCYHRMPEVEQMLRTLESGSSSKSRISGALKDFQAVLPGIASFSLRVVHACDLLVRVEGF